MLSRHFPKFPLHFTWLTSLLLSVAILNCDSIESPSISTPVCSERLTQSDVESIIAHAVEQAQRLDQKVTIGITDREGNVLGVFRMNSSSGDPDASIAKARTAAFLSSSQHGFTSLTACFITRSHFPPGISNTPAGPLYGVPLSSLPGGDIQPNGNGLSGSPGGVPIFKNDCLVGGIGISGAVSQFDLNSCSGRSLDETIALGAVLNNPVPESKRGDNIFINGIRFLYSNVEPPSGNFTLSFASVNTSSIGSVVPPFSIRATPAPKFPLEGEVLLGTPYNFPIRGGLILTVSEVRRIIDQAREQSDKTRAAIRTPLGSAARVFIAVADINGSILGIWQTPDATIFSFDVSAQKARTVVAFSNPSNVDFGRRIRTILGLSPTQQLAITTRAIGFLAQDFFPPGIDRDSLGNPLRPGPLYEGPEFAYQKRIGTSPFGNGITIFPGGIPLYKNGMLVGGIGISGDGVDQDDLIAFAGSIGFEPPIEIRCDNFFYQGVRLPYVKLPRRPEL